MKLFYICLKCGTRIEGYLDGKIVQFYVDTVCATCGADNSDYTALNKKAETCTKHKLTKNPNRERRH